MYHINVFYCHMFMLDCHLTMIPQNCGYAYQSTPITANDENHAEIKRSAATSKAPRILPNLVRLTKSLTVRD